jgi:hypothetical protein
MMPTSSAYRLVNEPCNPHTVSRPLAGAGLSWAGVRGGLAALLLLGALAAVGPSVRAADTKKDAVVARYAPPPSDAWPSILLRRPAGKSSWQRLSRDQRDIAAGDTLLSLPGYRSEVRFTSGVDLTLWGDMRELSFVYPVLESEVVSNNARDIDLDLTLNRGRIVLANRKANKPAKVRVRFYNPAAKDGKDVWEITLAEKDAEVALDLWGRYPAGVRFRKGTNPPAPTGELYMYVLKGQASVRTSAAAFAMKQPPGPSLIFWSSEQEDIVPQRLNKSPEWVNQSDPPLPKGLSNDAEKKLRILRRNMVKALKELGTHMKDDQVEATLAEALQSPEVSMRILAVRCHGAIGDLSPLLDALVNKKHPEVRDIAVEELRHWIGQNRDNGQRLHDTLAKKKYSSKEADVIMGLLPNLSDSELKQPETYSRLIDYLRQDEPAIRVLAHWHLVRLVPGGSRILSDPLGDAGRLYEAWKKLVPEGTLPKVPMKKP